MQFLDDKQKKLVADLVLRKVITPARFCREYPVALCDIPSLVVSILRDSLKSKDEGEVAAGMALGFFFGFSNDHVDALLSLALEPWHLKHEDVAMALDGLRLRDPRVAHVLFELALSKHEYLAYDDAYALGVKCIWALGNMGTVEAVDGLGRLGKVGNPIFVENVEEQLERIERRGPSEDVREALARVRSAS